MAIPTRNSLIDCLKGLACATIVWHHLAYYGPMSDVAHPVLPGLLDWLYNYGRMAVQVFLVLGGYLAAASLAPSGLMGLVQAGPGSPLPRIGRRFVRLVGPYAAALIVTIVISAFVRPWFRHDSVSADPDLWQLLAHALLLHGVAGQESLSAGVWYVAIDFQLYALTTLLFGAAHALAAWRQGRSGATRPWAGASAVAQAMVVAGVAASVYGFNLDLAWENWAVYFFGAYGLGMMAYWAVEADRHSTALGWCLLIAALVATALALQWRDRLALAGLTALLLVAVMRTPPLREWGGLAPLRALGRISYSAFLIHFSVCLLVNAVVAHYWPCSVPAALVGMASAFALSMGAGWLLYLAVERQPPVSFSEDDCTS